MSYAEDEGFDGYDGEDFSLDDDIWTDVRGCEIYFEDMSLQYARNVRSYLLRQGYNQDQLPTGLLDRLERL